ncbi:MAG: hypothetical protein HKN91_08635 [Acidimicrobiia bacterium]|nr:hypothetical protein [Acidimicrobiia bacterium]
MTTQTLRALAVAGALALLILPAELQGQWGGEFRMQMGIGGDAIAGVEYSDGSDSELKLGTYFSFTAGPIFDLWSSDNAAVELQGMVGWAGWSTGPENTDDRLSLSRFPTDLLVFYRHSIPGRDMSIRVGGGIAHHVLSDVGGSGSLENFELGVENSTGPVAEVSMVFGILSAGVRYTQMNNVVEGIGDPLAGTSVGLFFGLTNPRN